MPWQVWLVVALAVVALGCAVAAALTANPDESPRRPKVPAFVVGDKVLVEDTDAPGGAMWIPGTVVGQPRALRYRVAIEGGGGIVDVGRTGIRHRESKFGA